MPWFDERHRSAVTRLAQRFLRLCAGALLCVAATGCSILPASVDAEFAPPAPGEANPYGSRLKMPLPPAATPEAEAFVLPKLSDLPLASGQIIAVDDTAGVAMLHTLFASEFKPWVHLGIVVIEPEGPVVYDVNGDMFFLPGVSPAKFGDGYVRRWPLAEFLKYHVHSERFAGLFAPPGEVNVDGMMAFIRKHHEARTPFDHYFNLDNQKELYCSEFVALALEAGGLAPVTPIPTRDNRSLAAMREYVGITAKSVILPGQLVDPSRLKVMIAGDVPPAHINVHFEIRRELHRRLFPDTRVGLLLEIDAAERTMHFREDVLAFIQRTLRGLPATDMDQETVRAHVLREADQFFTTVSSPATAALSP